MLSRIEQWKVRLAVCIPPSGYMNIDVTSKNNLALKKYNRNSRL